MTRGGTENIPRTGSDRGRYGETSGCRAGGQSRRGLPVDYLGGGRSRWARGGALAPSGFSPNRSRSAGPRLQLDLVAGRRYGRAATVAAVAGHPSLGALIRPTAGGHENGPRDQGPFLVQGVSVRGRVQGGRARPTVIQPPEASAARASRTSGQAQARTRWTQRPAGRRPDG